MPELPGLLVPQAPSGFISQDGLLLPAIYSREHREALLKDYGLCFALTHQFAFGEPWGVEELSSSLTDQDPLGVVGLAAHLARSAAMDGNGNLDIPAQRELFDAAVADAKQVGLALVRERSVLDSGAAYSPETANGLALSGFWVGSRGATKGSGSVSPRRLARACLALNDALIGPAMDHVAGTRLFHLENLRRCWMQGPLLGTSFSAAARWFRFRTLTDRTLKALSTNLANDVRAYFRASYGVVIEQFLDLISIPKCAVGDQRPSGSSLPSDRRSKRSQRGEDPTAASLPIA